MICGSGSVPCLIVSFSSLLTPKTVYRGRPHIRPARNLQLAKVCGLYIVATMYSLDYFTPIESYIKRIVGKNGYQQKLCLTLRLHHSSQVHQWLTQMGQGVFGVNTILHFMFLFCGLCDLQFHVLWDDMTEQFSCNTEMVVGRYCHVYCSGKDAISSSFVEVEVHDPYIAKK